MKKSIVILTALLLITSSLFAAVSDDSNKTIVIKAPVEGYALFGVTSSQVDYTNFKSRALFESAVDSTIDTEIEILDLSKAVPVGYVSGINNTHNKVSLYISTSNLKSGDDESGLKVVTNYASIPGSSDSKIGVLNSTLLEVTEKVPGAAALAPAGSYEATLTISLQAD